MLKDQAVVIEHQKQQISDKDANIENLKNKIRSLDE